MTWEWTQHPSDLRGTVTNAINGSEREAALVPLALLYLAAVAAAVATSGWLRRVLGALVVAAGIAALWFALHEVAGVFEPHPDGYPLAQVVSGHALAVLAGLLAVAAGVVLVLRGAVMPRMGARYAAPGAAKRVPAPDRKLWDELSDGHDPTAQRPDR